MKITFIHHSSFLVETARVSLLFDYTEGNFPEVGQDKPLIVFASHRHGDHFSPKIFDLASRYSQIHYVLSDDIWQSHVPEALYSKVDFMDPGSSLILDLGFELSVAAYKSTDEGVAFLLTCEGKHIYHAGDLNNWMWQGEAKEWNDKMCQDYRAEIDKLTGLFMDVAFLPLDGRQEELFYLGMDDFLSRIEAGRVFPMHCWDDFTVIPRMKSMECAKNYRDKIMDITKDGDSCEI